jgi:hypothetical protein
MWPTSGDSLTLALAQLNPTVGDIAGNLAAIRAARTGCASDLIVCSELALIGYPVAFSLAFDADAPAVVPELAQDGPGRRECRRVAKSRNRAGLRCNTGLAIRPTFRPFGPLVGHSPRWAYSRGGVGSRATKERRTRGFVKLQKEVADRAVVLRHRRADPRAAVRRCREEKIVVNQRAGRVRVSPHCYNTPDEMDRVVDVLASIRGSS